MKNIRNFCIIAHIDHGKSTLADRLLEITQTVSGKDLQDQVLDNMDLERERGITIKSHAIQMNYSYKGEQFVLNLIDTPGHVDFSYEVSRSIAACEGALLIVDAAQGIQAQTISNLYMALEHDLEIIPIVNKCDLPSAMPDEVEDQIIDLLGCDRADIIRASGKTGLGVDEILSAIVERIPAPVGDPNGPLQCLIFDSVFNSFRGIIAYFKVVNGSISKGDRVKFMATECEYDADEVGVLKLGMSPRNTVNCGDVGYIISGIKTSKEVKVGDTITHINRPAPEAIAGFEEVKPMVFAGVYPIETEDFENLRASLEKLQLNDASLTFQPESSAALGFGFRCGFLGLLHMEIIQERLDREFGMNVITTVPNVSYKVYDKKGSCTEVHNPSGLPDPTLIDHIEEPYIRASVITNTAFIGPIMTLCLGKRGILIKQEYIHGDRVELIYDLPLGEIVIDFYDKLKSISKGYASFDYHISDFRPSKLVKLDILLNGETVDALSTLTHFDNAQSFGRRMCEKLKELIPRQQFDIAIQAAIGAKIIARETVKAVRKDVTAKCYGGDISRKRKLLEKQKEGKKRMKQIGSVEVPQKAFLAVFEIRLKAQKLPSLHTDMPATKGKKSKLQDPVVIANPIEGRIPPQAIELEEAVLGAILLEKDAYSSVSDLLKPSTFYLKIHQLIYEAIVSLASKQKPIDLLTVTEELRRTEKLDEVGGPSYIASLTLRVAGSANLEYHAAILAQKSMSRQLISFSSKVLKNAFDDIEDIEDQMQSAEAELFEISQRNLKEEVRQINPIIKQALDEISIAANQTSGISGITSGFPAIDKMTSGWQRSDLVIIAARPAMGKTAFVLSMARNIAVDYNIPVAVFNLEMSSVQLVKRLISNVCEIPGDKIKSGRLEKYEWAQLDKKLQVLTDKPLFIDETPSLSIFELRTKARRLVREHGVQIIIIDYLQLMNASGMNVGNREQEVSMISRSLKVLAKELKIPIIALSQLNRGVETRQGDFNSKRPQLSDLRESGAIEQDADIVCFIHRPEYYKIFQDPDGNSLIGLAEFIIAKHRNGPIGDVRIRFRAEFAKFLPLEAELSTIRESAAGRTDEEAQDPLAVMGTTPLQSQDDFLSGTPLTDLPY